MEGYKSPISDKILVDMMKNKRDLFESWSFVKSQYGEKNKKHFDAYEEALTVVINSMLRYDKEASIDEIFRAIDKTLSSMYSQKSK